jgi:hypothetical protein
MHGYPESVVFYELANILQAIFKVAGPIKFADRVRCKWYDVRAYSEEQKTVLAVIFQNLFEAGQVLCNGIY